jgi:hypothetical protein
MQQGADPAALVPDGRKGSAPAPSSAWPAFEANPMFARMIGAMAARWA